MRYYKQSLSRRKIDGHISLLEINYTEIKLLSDKQPIEVLLIQKAVKPTIQILYDKIIW